MKEKFYTLQNILKYNATYNMIFGERSNGKTYSVLEYGLNDYITNKKRMAIIRRWETDFQGKNRQQIFDGLINNKVISKLTRGEFNSVFYYSQRWYLSFIDENGKKIKQDETPFCYAFALTSEEHYKSNSFPHVNTILFDEFLTRSYYLPDEFVKFQSIISTIVRLRDDVKIFMLGNTVNKYSPYFSEMGLTNVKNQAKGTIDFYTYGDSGLSVAVEYCSMATKHKKSNKYFAFNNPKLNMIKNGSWEIDIYPHLPIKYSSKDVLYTYFIKFDNEILQCEIINKNDVCFTFIHRKTTPIKEDNTSIVFQQEHDVREHYKRKITKPTSKIEQRIATFFLKDKVFYQNNEVGEIINNYIMWCKKN